MSSKWQQQSFRQRSPKSRKKKQVTLRCILCQALNKQTTLLWSGKAHWHLTSFTGFTALHACTDYKPPKICIIFFPFLYLFFLETVTQITWAEDWYWSEAIHIHPLSLIQRRLEHKNWAKSNYLKLENSAHRLLACNATYSLTYHHRNSSVRLLALSCFALFCCLGKVLTWLWLRTLPAQVILIRNWLVPY